MLAIVVGGVLGTGIYIRPASIAQLLGSPTLILGVWLAGGMLSLCGALTYAQLAIRIPGTGSEYLFLRTTLGSLPAFLYGWMRLTVSPAAIGFQAVAKILAFVRSKYSGDPAHKFGPAPQGH